MKKCFKCNIEKPLDEFYKHPMMGDKHLNKCKECTKKDVRENYIRKIQDPNEIIKERLRTRLKFHRLYKGRSKIDPEHNKKYAEKYPEKYKAKILTGNAIKYGKLVRQPCEVCGLPEAQAHHDDYSKPLEVRWLCIKCHNEYHVRKREQQLLDKFRCIA